MYFSGSLVYCPSARNLIIGDITICNTRTCEKTNKVIPIRKLSSEKMGSYSLKAILMLYSQAFTLKEKKVSIYKRSLYNCQCC